MKRMALFRLEAKILSREKKGRSVIAPAAYRAGLKLKDELKDKIFDYARRAKGVLDSTILGACRTWKLSGERFSFGGGDSARCAGGWLWLGLAYARSRIRRRRWRGGWLPREVFSPSRPSGRGCAAV